MTLILLCCGGATIVGLTTDPKTRTPTGSENLSPARSANPANAEPARQSSDPAATPPTTSTPAEPTATAPTPPTATGVVEKRRVTETQAIPFQTRTVEDPSLARGTEKVRTNGVNGVKTLTYEVTTTNGVQTDKRLASEAVTKAPVTKVVAVGTKQSSCDSNYSGCVPIASDVDCAGGSGNGPAYVTGPVTVVGTDIYDLDSDNDGIGCE